MGEHSNCAICTPLVIFGTSDKFQVNVHLLIDISYQTMFELKSIYNKSNCTQNERSFLIITAQSIYDFVQQWKL